MTRPYRFFINPFLSITRTSNRIALTVGVDHHAKLVGGQADPDIAELLLSFKPVLDAFISVNSNLNGVLGGYKARTQNVEELFETVNSEKLAYWEGQIFYFYPKGTVKATELFPKKRRPFQQGTYEQRIQAIKTLGNVCAATPNLAAVGANILAFHTQIESARVAQQSDGEAAVAAQRSLRETARLLLCEELFGNMAALMHKFRKNPEAVGDFFEMELLRRRGEDDNEDE